MITAKVIIVDFPTIEKVNLDLKTGDKVYEFTGVGEVIERYLERGFALHSMSCGTDFTCFQKFAVNSPVILTFIKDDGNDKPQDTTDSDPNRIQKP